MRKKRKGTYKVLIVQVPTEIMAKIDELATKDVATTRTYIVNKILHDYFLKGNSK